MASYCHFVLSFVQFTLCACVSVFARGFRRGLLGIEWLAQSSIFHIRATADVLIVFRCLCLSPALFSLQHWWLLIEPLSIFGFFYNVAVMKRVIWDTFHRFI